MFIVVSMYGQNAAGFANNGMAYHESELRPVSAFISGVLFSGQTSTTVFLYEFFWWMHILLIFGFLKLFTLFKASSRFKFYSKCVLCKFGSC